jgi:hypothetical protein
MPKVKMGRNRRTAESAAGGQNVEVNNIVFMF